MRLIVKGQLSGEFTGFDGDRVYEFTNGQKWQQSQYKYKYCYKYRPKAYIWDNGGRRFLQVDGVEDMVPVRKI